MATAVTEIAPNSGWLMRGRRILLATGVGFVVGVLVCLPWFGHGWVIFLDWGPSFHGAILPKSVFGLSGGLIASLPLGIVDTVLVTIQVTTESRSGEAAREVFLGR